MKVYNASKVQELPTRGKSRKTIRYEGNKGTGEYAVIEYTRQGERWPFRSRIIHGV